MGLNASYSSGVVSIGKVDFPLRMLVPVACALAALCGSLRISQVDVHRPRHRRRRAGSRGAAADRVDPVRIKTIAFAISVGLAALAGGALIVIQPVDSTSAQDFRRTTCSPSSSWAASARLPGSLIAALLFGVIERFDRDVARPVLVAGGRLRPPARVPRAPTPRIFGAAV